MNLGVYDMLDERRWLGDNPDPQEILDAADRIYFEAIEQDFWTPDNRIYLLVIGNDEQAARRSCGEMVSSFIGGDRSLLERINRGSSFISTYKDKIRITYLSQDAPPDYYSPFVLRSSHYFYIY